MDLKTLGTEQRNALIDLLVLGMYADGHLARAEDGRIARALQAMGWDARSDQEREFDAAVTRVRKYSDSKQQIQIRAQALARAFSSADDRRQALAALEEVLASDHRVTPAEGRFLDVIRSVFA